MTFEEALVYIKSLDVYGSVLGLDNMLILARELGNPQDKLKFVHVAGTNGKGSTIAFLSSILKEAKIPAAVYTSPAVIEYRERFVFDGRMISKALFGRLFELVAAASDEIENEGNPHPTVFEMETALFFLFALERKAQVVILETGMGGLLDATNIIKNTLLCVFPSISMDHMQFLGNSLEKIAGNKAGILKKGCAAITITQRSEAQGVIEEACDKLGVELRVARPENASHIKNKLGTLAFDYKSEHVCIKGVRPGLCAEYQIDNAILAIEAAAYLAKVCGIPDERFEDIIHAGIASASWPGRFEIISKKPLFIIDGAHNEDAARRLYHTVCTSLKDRKIIMIMGVLADKEYEKVASIMTPIATQILTVTPPSNRALHALDLAKCITEINPNVTAVDSCEEAVEISCMMAGTQDVILAFGTLSFLGKIKALVSKK